MAENEKEKKKTEETPPKSDSEPKKDPVQNHTDPTNNDKGDRTSPYYDADIIKRLDLIEESIKPLMNFVATRYEEPKVDTHETQVPKEDPKKDETTIEDIKNLIL